MIQKPAICVFVIRGYQIPCNDPVFGWGIIIVIFDKNDGNIISAMNIV
jgi:hypothetical protein